jgi:DNA-directed RNA polymerase subunit omega
MLKPPINELIDIAGSRYALVILTSRRARQIIDGAEVFVDDRADKKPMTIATQELYEHKLEIIDFDLED